MTSLNQATNNATTNIILKGEVLSEMDVDDLLALDVNSIDEVKDFVPMPTGFYRFNVSGCDLVELGDDKLKAIKVEFNLTECEELANPDCAEDVEVIAASFVEGETIQHVEHYFLKTSNVKSKSAYGVRAFATLFKAVIPQGQTAVVTELMEICIGSSGLALLEKSSYIPQGKTEEDRKWSTKVKPTGVAFD